MVMTDLPVDSWSSCSSPVHTSIFGSRAAKPLSNNTFYELLFKRPSIVSYREQNKAKTKQHVSNHETNMGNDTLVLMTEH